MKKCVSVLTLTASLLCLAHPVTSFGSNCHTAGTYNSVVLALSWSRGFCSTHKFKPECRDIAHHDPHLAYANKSFTLHGLWPNKSDCGIHYGSCAGNYHTTHFCSLPAVNLNQHVFSRLEQVMPSAYAGSCLQRHEWYKHGTCVLPENANHFFSTAIELTQQVNHSSLVQQFVHNHLGQQVTVAQFQQAFDHAFGNNAHHHMAMYCSHHHILTEVRITLPAHFSSTTTLRQLFPHSKTTEYTGNCGTYFKLL